MPDAVYGHTLIFTQQLADFYRPIGWDPARGIIRLADRDRLRIHAQARGLRGNITAGQPPGCRTQRRIILPDDQQQFVGGVTRVIDNLQQRFIGLRQPQPADLVTRMADNNTVTLR